MLITVTEQRFSFDNLRLANWLTALAETTTTEDYSELPHCHSVFISEAGLNRYFCQGKL